MFQIRYYKRFDHQIISNTIEFVEIPKIKKKRASKTTTKRNSEMIKKRRSKMKKRESKMTKKRMRKINMRTSKIKKKKRMSKMKKTMPKNKEEENVENEKEEEENFENENEQKVENKEEEENVAKKIVYKMTQKRASRMKKKTMPKPLPIMIIGKEVILPVKIAPKHFHKK